MLEFLILAALAYIAGPEWWHLFKLSAVVGVGLWGLRGLLRGRKARPAKRARHTLADRWRDEARRMDEARQADEDADAPTEESALCEEEPEDTDEAFCGLDFEKEAARMRKVLEGLYTRRDRMLFSWDCMDGRDGEAKAARMAKLERTKSWRGLQLDIEYAEKRLALLEAE